MQTQTHSPKVPNEIAEKPRVEEIRKLIRAGKTLHPEDMAWIADEAYRLHIVRENAASRLKELHAKVARFQAWIASVAGGVEAHGGNPERMDGGDWAQLAGGWQQEARALLDYKSDPEDDEPRARLPDEMVIEYHYQDGDIGAHPLEADERLYAAMLWAGFAADEMPARIVLRPADPEGN